MTFPFRLLAASLLGFSLNTAQAYGTGQSSSHCDKPVFSDYQPAANKYLQSFSEFSFIASSNTTPTSIEVQINAGPNKYHLTHKDLEITPQKSGRFHVEGKLPRPLEHGFVRLNITAHSKPGCEKTDGYLLRIQ